MFLACLDHARWAEFHLGILGPQEWKKSSDILSPKKGQISGLAQIDIFSDFLVLGVANFRINYLRQFSFNFENSCAHLAANFLNFSKHTQLFTFGWFWRKLWTNNQKNWKSEKCQFEQILKSDLFSGQDFWTFFIPVVRRKPKLNFAHIAWSKQGKKIRKTPMNSWFPAPCFRTRRPGPPCSLVI